MDRKIHFGAMSEHHVRRVRIEVFLRDRYAVNGNAALHCTHLSLRVQNAQHFRVFGSDVTRTEQSVQVSVDHRVRHDLARIKMLSVRSFKRAVRQLASNCVAIEIASLLRKALLRWCNASRRVPALLRVHCALTVLNVQTIRCTAKGRRGLN